MMLNNCGRPAVLALMLLSVGLLAVEVFSPVSANQSLQKHSAVDHRLQLLATLDGKIFAPQAPILLSCALRNRSNETVVVWLSGFWTNHQVVVKNDKHEKQPLTAAGKQYAAAFSQGGSRIKNIPYELGPGETYSYNISLDLHDLYILRSGRYTVEVVYEDLQAPDPVSLRSPRLSFEIRG